MTVTILDDHGALPAIFVPATVQTAIMPIVAIFGSRSAELTACPIVAAISVHAPIAANADAELLSTCNTWKAYSYRRQRSTS
jgi:biotin transporter BioY